MKVKVTSRDMVLLNPGELYDMPDEIATQLMARGSVEGLEEMKAEPETKKEHMVRMKQEKADAK